MKINKYIISSVFTAILIIISSILVSCDDTIEVGTVDETNYETTTDLMGFLTDIDGKRAIDNIEFRSSGSSDFFFNASKKTTENCIISLSYDKSVLDDYNNKNDSQYEAFPVSNVNIGDNGLDSMQIGETRSNGIKISYTSSSEIKANQSYVIPIKLKVISGNLKLNENELSYLIFVKDMTGIPDCNKSTGIKIISCMEVNDTNPLNNLCFTLKSNGKPLIDMVILFSANINYNEETGRVYVYNNENIQALLNNREHYLKPLQDRGVKIILGILGNHDRSGVANLSNSSAKLFAQELKAICNSYHLDGVFFDDEYSSYMTPVPPGFVSPSSTAAARLFYECKQAMPDKLTCSYVYSRTSSLPSIDGMQSGSFVDYGIHDYGRGTDLSSNYPGMSKSHMALYSQEFSLGRYTSDSNLQTLRTNGYGAHMIFAMDPNRSNLSRQMTAMQSIAKVLFDDELVYDGKPYSKDW
nr:DUF1735 domain-containing protein [uncultured Bacteroides sp.]